MPNHHTHEAVKSANFGLAFQQMCSIFAIAKTKNADETIRELILQSLALLPDERFYTSDQLSEAINVLFGLQLPIHEVENAIETLIQEQRVDHFPGSCMTLPIRIKEELLRRIEDAGKLERRVRDEWFNEIEINYPLIHLDELWQGLKDYLAKAFRRHGIQAVSLLNPLANISQENGKSLTHILSEVSRRFPSDFQNQVRSAIRDFMANVGNSADRTLFVSQLADGAFNYYSLTTAPDIAEEFRNKLSAMTIFLDTNFLFGILDLSIGPQVLVSYELVNSINKYDFPFSLKCHERTRRELLASVDHYRNLISSQILSKAISRAAIKSPYLSGVEHKFHERYAHEGIDLETFFRPYEHAEILLEQKNIEIFSPISNRLKERSALFTSYQNYLLYKQKEKPYEVIDHDVTVLDEVRQLRSESLSSLEAGALLVTCDYQLYLYDWEQCKKSNSLPCVVLPNLFWQLIRPFVPSDNDFDRSFAETFAIPEFRTIGSGSSVACSRAIGILSSYKDFPEETASRLLSNDILIERLRDTKDDNEFKQLIESAIVEDNNLLVEERLALSHQLEIERNERIRNESLLENAQKEKGKEKERADQAFSDVAKVHTQANEVIDEERRKALEANREKEIEKRKRSEAEERALVAEEEIKKTREKLILYYRISASILFSFVAVLGFEFTVNRLPWHWLVNHPNSIPIQICIDAIIISFLIGMIMPKFRKLWWTTVLLSLFTTFLTLIVKESS